MKLAGLALYLQVMTQKKANLFLKLLNEILQMTYGATIMPFLGGIHWGVAIANSSSLTTKEKTKMYALGVLPSLIAWSSLQFDGFEGLRFHI